MEPNFKDLYYKKTKLIRTKTPVLPFFDENELYDEEVTTQRVTINAFDKKFELTVDVFNQFPKSSRIGKLRNYRNLSHDDLLIICDDYNLEKLEFTFNRDPRCLALVINYVITGRLHNKTDLCPLYVERELKYWRMDFQKMQACCKKNYDKNREEKTNLINLEKKAIKKVRDNDIEKPTSIEKIWLATQKPLSSTGAKVYFIGVNLVLLTWSIYFMVTTLPSIRNHIEPPDGYNASASPFANIDQKVMARNLNIFDGLLFGLFAVDLVFRFLICPKKCKFFANFLNIIDLLTILAYWALFIYLEITFLSFLHKIRRVIESFRILLFYKLTKLDWRGSTIGIAIKKSLTEIGVAIFFILLSLLIISIIMFFIEVTTNDSYSSIPAAFWWLIVTLTTVGYGDMYPTSVVGKIFSGCVFLWSILMIVLPMAIIGSNFAEVYEIEGYRNEFTKEEEKRLFRIHEAQRLEEEYQRRLKEKEEYEERKRELEAKLTTTSKV